MEHDTLYRRILGSGFDRLDRKLRDFHDDPHGGAGRGEADVLCGEGPVRHLLARLLGLPAPGKKRPVELRVTPSNNGEIWDRRFGDDLLRTEQWEKEGLLMERAGPVTFRFALREEQGGLRFEYCGSSFLGVPLPRWLSPRVEAIARASEKGWKVDVVISAPLVGRITSYHGHIVPEP